MDEVPGGRFVGPTHQGHRPQDDPLVPTQVRRRCLDFPRGGTDSAVELPHPGHRLGPRRRRPPSAASRTVHSSRNSCACACVATPRRSTRSWWTSTASPARSASALQRRGLRVADRVLRAALAVGVTAPGPNRIAPCRYAPPWRRTRGSARARTALCDDGCVRVDHSSCAARRPPSVRACSCGSSSAASRSVSCRPKSFCAGTRAPSVPARWCSPEEERVFNPSCETPRIFGQARGIGMDAHRLAPHNGGEERGGSRT
jgi:hypothetical protein